LASLFIPYERHKKLIGVFFSSLASALLKSSLLKCAELPALSQLKYFLCLSAEDLSIPKLQKRGGVLASKDDKV
jgi:hypothetical protein